jgi:hypothetical protein
MAAGSARRSARKTPASRYEAAGEGLLAAPASAPRSSSRTPRVVIIERAATPTTTGAVRSAAKSAGPAQQPELAGGVARGTQTTPHQPSTMAIQTRTEDSGEDVEQQAAGEDGLEMQGRPGAWTTQVRGS